jgi:hypothetical protein
MSLVPVGFASASRAVASGPAGGRTPDANGKRDQSG